MSELWLERVWSAPLKDVSLRRASGLSVVVGTESDGSGALVELCAGVRVPRRGRVTLGGARPSASPACRRGIASLLPEEFLGNAGSVQRRLEELAGFGVDPAAVLAGCDVSHERPLASLSGAERRELALALALAHPEPTLVVLHEPLSACAGGRRERVLERIVELGSTCPVVVATASIDGARQLGGNTYLLDRGLLDEKPAGAWPGSFTNGAGAWLAIEADAPRRLIAALAQHPDVRELRYDELRGGRVLVGGPDLELLAVAVGRAAVSAGVDVRHLRSPAEDLSRARAGASRAVDARVDRTARAEAGAAHRLPAGTPPVPPPEHTEKTP